MYQVHDKMHDKVHDKGQYTVKLNTITMVSHSHMTDDTPLQITTTRCIVFSIILNTYQITTNIITSQKILPTESIIL